MDNRYITPNSAVPSYGTGFQQNSEPKKHTICRNFWSSGYCGYGDRCIFAHSPYDKPAAVRNMSMNEPRQICKHFARGSCPFDRCIFIHQKPQMPEENWAVPRVNTAINIQTEAARVVDANSDQFMKTRLCNKWRGPNTCVYGDKCTFAHGRAELRSDVGMPAANVISWTTSRTVNNNENASNYIAARQTAHVTQKVSQEPKVCQFKWNRKIAGIYGDWLDGMSLEPSSSSKQQE